MRRGGRKLSVAAADLVPGDIVLLREGDRISADARVVGSSELKVDMSALTGESKPICAVTSPHRAELRDALDRSNVVFAGTFVTSGSGVAVVADTGAATRLGKITELTAGVVRRPTPLRFEMNRVVRVIAVFAVVPVSVLRGGAGSGHPAPRWLPVCRWCHRRSGSGGPSPTLSLSLAMSATRMSHRGALVRRLESVETLGCTTVVCTDKTGTITTNQMTARAVVLPQPAMSPPVRDTTRAERS